MRSIIWVWGAALVAAGCGVMSSSSSSSETPSETDDDDAVAEAAPLAALDKADASTLTGLFATSATSLRAGDVPSLELRADGRYVRARCYHTRCSAQIAETDRFDIAKSNGHKYLRFWSFTITTDANGDRTPTPVIADVYEVKRAGKTIQLRKTYSSRWLTLDATKAADLCDATGGTWSSNDCACPGAGSAADTHGGFVAGAGGCIDVPGGGEDACDGSGGLYADDDATPIGTYCLCGLGRYVELGPGACAKI